MNIRVRAGDSLWYYSQLFNLPLPLIIDSNPGVSPTGLQIGQSLRIPGYLVDSYTIQPGDTLWRIAQEIGINVDALQLLNPALNPLTLQVGQTISIPVRVTRPLVQGNRAYDYNAMITDLRLLAEVYPFMFQRTIGQSVMGKEIVELRLGRGAKRVHMNGSFHAHEWITTPILMQTLNTYLLALTNAAAIRGREVLPLYEATLLSLVPMVNPDGVDLVIHGAPEEEPYRSNVLAINNWSPNFSGWKANIRGVDLNNQYPALWAEEAARRPRQPSPANFPGYQPLTEPEAIAMANLTREGNFDRVLAYHTQGKVIFWGFQGLEPPEAETIVNEFARVSGFRPIQYVDSFAGYKDWFIQEWRRPGYTVELGRGVNPLPLTQFEEIYQENLGIFLASLYM